MKKIIIRLLALLSISLCIFILIGLDPRLQTNYFDYQSSKIPKRFDGFKIVQLSDFHLKRFGENQNTLINAVKECYPDVIVLTGDVVDEEHSDISPLEELLIGIKDLAPIYFITGNHDVDPYAAAQYTEMFRLFEQYDVINLDDSSKFITFGEEKICITGSKWRSGYFTDFLPAADTDYFNILLYHGSDYFPTLSNFDYDLIFAGHVHGGIIRLPFVGGLLSNDGTLFPPYDGGSYSMYSSTMVSSRGLGDAKFPRFYNRPEIVCTVLHSSEVVPE